MTQAIRNENTREVLSLYDRYPFAPLKFEVYDGILFDQWVEKAKQHDSKQKAPSTSTAINYDLAFDKFLDWVKRYTYSRQYPEECKTCKFLLFKIVDQYPTSPHTSKKKVYECGKKRCKQKAEWWDDYL